MTAGIELHHGSITDLNVDVIVNAANATLLGGDHNEADLLASCYRRSLELATSHNLKSIAFPAIRTGAYTAIHLKQQLELQLIQ